MRPPGSPFRRPSPGERIQIMLPPKAEASPTASAPAITKVAMPKAPSVDTALEVHTVFRAPDAPEPPAHPAPSLLPPSPTPIPTQEPTPAPVIQKIESVEKIESVIEVRIEATDPPTASTPAPPKALPAAEDSVSKSDTARLDAATLALLATSSTSGVSVQMSPVQEATETKSEAPRKPAEQTPSLEISATASATIIPPPAPVDEPPPAAMAPGKDALRPEVVEVASVQTPDILPVTQVVTSKLPQAQAAGDAQIPPSLPAPKSESPALPPPTESASTPAPARAHKPKPEVEAEPSPAAKLPPPLPQLPAHLKASAEQIRTTTVPDKTSTAPVEGRRIAVAGNPNCGKTTLFNALTGLRQKVGNYPGVTVEKKEGTFHGSHGEVMHLLDLPGCYSLQSRSPDEAVARDVLLGRQSDTPRPDAVLAVVDATNLERNLYLVCQLLELGLPVILALNMVDLAEKAGITINLRLLSEKLGIPVIPLVASRGTGLIPLRQALSQSPLPLPLANPSLPEAIAGAAARIAPLLPPNGAQLSEAVLLLGLTPGQLAESMWISEEVRAAVIQGQAALEAAALDPVAAVVDARYAWIHEVCSAAVHKPEQGNLSISDKLDTVLTHRFWGWLIFLGAMALMFFSIFTIAKIPADWISTGQTLFANWVQSLLPEGDFRSLVVDGVIAGVAGVAVFLPQILTLTFFLGLLEDSGYMARAAFLMDRLMSKVGLHGKSFIPMLSSFACAIPGIMATRTIEQRKDRLVTILVAPLMSCSARLPVYTLLITVLLPEVALWKKSAIMLSMYLIGVVTALLMAWLFKRTLLKGETPALLMEMPPYRMPSMAGIFLRMRERAWIFIKRAGTVIVALSVLLWSLMTYPKPANPEATGAEQLSHSVAGRIGHAIEPVIAPLGFDWKIGIGLVGSLAAREVFNSTMGIVYSVEGRDGEAPIAALSQTMREEKRADGSPLYTPLTGTSLMVFYVLAMQCLSTLAVVRRETNSWRWPLFQLFYMTSLAYAASLLIFQGGKLLGLH